MARVLVIDDDRIIRKIIESNLTSLGYEVIIATNGQEGLQLLKAHQPDVVITDKVMPGLDGIEVTKRIRRDPAYAHLPILMLTGESDLEDKLGAFEAGADDYLGKPFEVAELAARLTALLRRAEAIKAAQTKQVESGEKATLIAVHSLRGGVGTTSLATNLAVALNNLWQVPTLLLDMALTAGQIALMLNKPLKHTWADLSEFGPEELDVEATKGIVSKHECGLHFISSPANPTQAEMVQHETISKAVSLLRPGYEYIVADLPHDFSDYSLDVLDSADTILLVLSPEMAAIRAAAIALDTYNKLGYDKDKIKLIINWTFEQGGLAQKKIEAALHHPVSLVVPFAPNLFVGSINRGIPFVLNHPENSVSALMEDFAFRLSKKAHQGIPPASPSETWHRVNQRLKLFNTGNRKQKSLLPFT
ncbi:MAG: response regulator [Chloroflexi bacterium]|nr:MAG: response regulator [Chloroflexota bacterium]